MAYRAIHDDVPVSDSLNALSDFAERLYWRMLASSDDCGRGPGTITKIASLCIPRLAKAPEDVRDALEELVRTDRIALALVHGIWVYEIIDFAARQPIAHRKHKRVSRYPSPLDTDSSTFVADAVPLFDLDQAETVPRPHTAVDKTPDTAPARQLSAGSGQNKEEEIKEEQTRTSRARASTSLPPGCAGLSDFTIETPVKVELDVARLLTILPDHDRSTAGVLRAFLVRLPPHAAQYVEEELEAASSVRRPTAWVVGVLKRWSEHGIQRGAA